MAHIPNVSQPNGAKGGKQFTSLQKVYDRAIAIERRRQQKSTAEDSSNFESNQPKDKKVKLEEGEAQGPAQTLCHLVIQKEPGRKWQDEPTPCPTCRRRHLTKECPKPNACQRCGRIGHQFKECRTRYTKIRIRNDLKKEARQELRRKIPVGEPK